MKAASIVLALCLLAKASAEDGGQDMGTSAECTAANVAYAEANGNGVMTCNDADGNEVEGTCEQGSLPAGTASLTATSSCITVTYSLATAAATYSDGSDPCSGGCTSAVADMEKECDLDMDQPMIAAQTEIVSECSSATMAGAVLALIAVALF